MCTDYKVDTSLLQLLYYLLLLLWRTETAQQLNIHGEVLEAAEGSLVVLVGKYCCRSEYGALLACEHALHGGSQSYLRLSEAHVAAEQSLHRTGTLHVSLYLGNGGELVVCLNVWETLLEIPLYLVVGIECEAHALLALCVQGDELLRHVLYGAFYVASGLLPLPRA